MILKSGLPTRVKVGLNILFSGGAVVTIVAFLCCFFIITVSKYNLHYIIWATSLTFSRLGSKAPLEPASGQSVNPSSQSWSPTSQSSSPSSPNSTAASHPPSPHPPNEAATICVHRPFPLSAARAAKRSAAPTRFQENRHGRRRCGIALWTESGTGIARIRFICRVIRRILRRVVRRVWSGWRWRRVRRRMLWLCRRRLGLVLMKGCLRGRLYYCLRSRCWSSLELIDLLDVFVEFDR